MISLKGSRQKWPTKVIFSGVLKLTPRNDDTFVDLATSLPHLLITAREFSKKANFQKSGDLEKMKITIIIITTKYY